MYPIKNVRSALGEYFDRQADWRDRKAEEYPDDDRNQRAANWLRDVVKYVLALPDTDARLVNLASVDDAFVAPDGDVVESLARGDGTPIYSQDYAARYSFDDWVSPGKFFDQWCERFIQDCESYREWFGKQNW